MSSGCCRYRPTCSQYAIEALKEWGLICGMALAIWRIIRCNPFSKGGFDPVPKRKWHWRKKASRRDDCPLKEDITDGSSVENTNSKESK